MEDRFIKRLVSSMKCNVCGQRYVADNINVLGHQEELWFLSVFCPSCRTQGLVAAVVKEERVQAIGELTPEDQERLSQIAPVSEDDLLDLHNFLKDFDGDFAGLFSKKAQ